jgi:hypothetical protein
MVTPGSRTDRLELEMHFRWWLWHTRLLERLNMEQLEEYACLGRLPDPLPKPLPRGKSELEGLDRKCLMQLWEEDLRFFGGRSKQALIFFTAHAHWPEQTCIEQKCGKATFDKIVNRHKQIGAGRDQKQRKVLYEKNTNHFSKESSRKS